MERGLISLPREPRAQHAYTPEEIQRIQTKLWRLLEKQTRRYTLEESTSVRVETAQELLQSLLYCLRLALQGKPDRRNLLLHGDYEALIRSGLELVQRETQRGLIRYQYSCSHPPAVTNRAYRDTMGDILHFFRSYHPQFFAHLVDCSIDYQLFLPVSERLLGISYLNAYLSRLALENQLINRFQQGAVLGCIQAACPDYEDLLVNLYEPVLQNAVGLALLGRDVTGLSVSLEERQRLQDQLEPLTEQERAAALGQAADALWEDLDLRDPAAKAELRQGVATLVPRLGVALEHHTLEGLFVTI